MTAMELLAEARRRRADLDRAMRELRGDLDRRFGALSQEAHAIAELERRAGEMIVEGIG